MNWALILAGGNGRRLASLTRRLSGDDRPKQFCRLFAGETLLTQTRARVALNVAPARTICIVTRDHEAYYRHELSELPPWQVIEQPRNRGTAAAIAYGLTRVSAIDRDAIIGLFPADHHYDNVECFRQAVEAAYGTAKRFDDLVLLLGTEADRAEVEYGWIEPGQPVDTESGTVFRVNRFWEKPSAVTAGELFTRHCLWNTFVLVSTLKAFRTILQSGAPELSKAFEPLDLSALQQREAAVAKKVYDHLMPCDFSKDVLSACSDRVAVMRLPSIGWTDLGRPSRVRTVLKTHKPSKRSLSVAS